MPRQYFNDGQEIVYSDLRSLTAQLERELYERVIYELMGRQADVLFGDGFKVSYVDGTHVSVAAGVGFQSDGAQVDPEPAKRLLYNASAASKAITTPDATNPRIDIVCIKANRATALTQSRNFKDAVTSVISSVSMTVETDWAADIVVTAGTPAVSPAAPATPAGYIKIAEVTVAASTGIAGAGSITDKRPIYQRMSSRSIVTSVTSTYSVTNEDEFIRTPSGTFTITLPLSTGNSGKIFEVKNPGAGVVTLAFSGAETADGQPTLTLNQYEAYRLRSNGANGYDIL